MEVAGGAGGLPVAADLHVPEERLAEHDEHALVGDVLTEGGGLRHRHALERGDRPETGTRASALCVEAGGPQSNGGGEEQRRGAWTHATRTPSERGRHGPFRLSQR